MSTTICIPLDMWLCLSSIYGPRRRRSRRRRRRPNPGPDPGSSLRH